MEYCSWTFHLNILHLHLSNTNSEVSSSYIYDMTATKNKNPNSSDNFSPALNLSAWQPTLGHHRRWIDKLARNYNTVENKFPANASLILQPRRKRCHAVGPDMCPKLLSVYLSPLELNWIILDSPDLGWNVEAKWTVHSKTPLETHGLWALPDEWDGDKIYIVSGRALACSNQLVQCTGLWVY